jgi:hypothetical protein
MPTVKEGGRVYVVLGAGTSPANHTTNTDEPTKGLTDQSELVAVLREQLAAEREANRENRRIIIALTSRVPELEASEGAPPQPEREAAEEPAPRPTGVPWWRRILGG